MAQGSREPGEHLKLTARDRDLGSALQNQTPREIDREIAMAVGAILLGAGGASQQGAQPRAQLGDGERLGEVIIGSRVEAGDPGCDVHPRREDENGGGHP